MMAVFKRNLKYLKYLKGSVLVISLCAIALWGGACATTGDDTGRGDRDWGTDDIYGTGIPGEGLDGTLYGLNDIYFDFDSSSLTPRAQEILKSNASWLKSNPSVVVEIEGHCDERGTIEYNLALGDRRARGVKDYLVNLGVSSSRMRTISFGEEMPLDPGHNETAWAKNRRAHFTITAK